MVVIDRREPVELSTYIARAGVEVSQVEIELEYGDVMFTGNGPDGVATIGCERKRLGDLINCMKDKRLSGHQLRGMRHTYEYIFVFVEDVWRPGSGGEIEEFKRGRDGKLGWYPFYSTDHEKMAISYRQVFSYLTTIALAEPEYDPLNICRRTEVIRSGYINETAKQIASLYTWFNNKEFAAHKSLDQIYTGAPAKGHGGKWASEHQHDEDYGRQRARLFGQSGDPTTVWRMASQLPGIDSRAREVAAHFGTVREMANASEQDWRQMKGIGLKTSKAIVRAISEEGA